MQGARPARRDSASFLQIAVGALATCLLLGGAGPAAAQGDGHVIHPL